MSESEERRGKRRIERLGPRGRAAWAIRFLRSRLVLAAMFVVAVLAVVPLVLLALVGRAITARRRRRGLRPRLVWGPVPLISIKYWSSALRERGYDSRSRVHSVASINSPDDFDDVLDKMLGSVRLAQLIWLHWTMGKSLLDSEIFFCFLDGSFLRFTPIARLEGPLLRLGGKKLIVSPYGGDIAVPGYLGPTEERLLEDYPYFVEAADKIKRTVDYYCRWADVVVRNWQHGYLPRADVRWVTMLAIDTEEWAPPTESGGADGHDGEVVVVHASNHRRNKGTDELIAAVEELRADGLRLRLELLERKTNAEVKEAIFASDIVADQFVTGYAMFAIEGMSAGKPVISAVSSMPADVFATAAMRECPLVDVDLATLKSVLRELAEDPGRRAELGRRGREFTLVYHSFESVGRTWEPILDHLWKGTPLPDQLPAADPEPRRAPAAAAAG